jgi:hypothetical protein
MIISTSPSALSKSNGSGSSSSLPALSLTEGKSFDQQINDLEAAYAASFKLLSAVAAKDKGKEKETVKTGVRSIIKMLENLKKHPSAVQYRKLRMDVCLSCLVSVICILSLIVMAVLCCMQNIVVKKYVTGLDGAQQLMEAVGFRKSEGMAIML